MDTSPFPNIVVVLDEPKDLVNIAGVIRSMKNMGLSRLRLVKPDDFDEYRICGIAHRSEDVVRGTEIFETLAEAVADAVFIVGTTARPRTAQRNYVRPREVAGKIVERAEEGTVALLFGREDRGLANEGLDLCHALAIIPTSPEYSSLNLAQACLLLAHEIFLAAGETPQPLPRGRRSLRPATQEELEQTYFALEKGLASIDFFKARKPESVMRVLRTVISRSEPDVQEAGLLAAVGFEVANYLERVLGGSPEERPGKGGGREDER